MCCIEVLRKICVLLEYYKIACRVQPVGVGDVLVLWNQKTSYSCICCSVLQVRPFEATANYEDGACVDVYASGFRGGKHQKTFFDVKVFNPNEPSYRGTQVSSLYQYFEHEKQRKYEQHIRKIEMVFLPHLYLRCGMGHAAAVFYKRHAFFVSLQKELSY